ncbi:serine/threonine-protein kinase [Oerskovia rustica]|uniref:non-specific serine/threonine protein kinase n=1 Tax=Oerskovia rustica TaxID=2762237 RepID=A0ABR8RVT3_9CELL|nr:serine/threonine-protein kinase [Oerskovia rustica]MBD7951717.1 serine/threonine protein kinase [Oerskovia rustica]
MSSKRAPSPPPLIDGYEYVSVVGSGGFSDVFLYQQQRPRRRVAIKVLLHEWSSESQRAAFDVEADLMATLSTHPSIVTMYEANVTSDGRPYLAMEYCSRPNLGARYRSERLSVAEALRVAVQIAGAVETAHRAGILHRDIKPANILVTEYGHPALTDFGISSTMDDASRAEGMSIPWSPPESFAEDPWAGKETDVWALAATTFTLLAGRAPFELPGGSNSSASLITRIESTPLAPTGRTDVPPSLERVLGTAMAKNPASRYPTMLAFARALQQVQNELSLAVTPIDVLADAGITQEEEADDDGGTRLRAVVSIDPRGGGAGGAYPTGAPSTTSGTAPVQRHVTVGASTGGSAPVAHAPAPHAPAAPGAYAGQPGAGAPAQVGYYAPAPARPAQAPASGPGYVPPRPAAGPGSTGTGTAVWGPPTDDTVHRAPGASPEPEPARPRTRRALWTFLAGAGILVLVVVGIYALLPDGTATDTDTGGGTTSADEPDDVPNDNLGDLVPPPEDLQAQYDVTSGSAFFTWSAPEDVEVGDTYAWQHIDPTKETWSAPVPAGREYVKVPAGETDTVCVEIRTVRDGKPSVPVKGCVNP